MRYLLLVYNEERKLDAMTQAELDALVADVIAWLEELSRRGHHVASAGLQSVRMAATVRSRSGRTFTTDGPFAETKEFLGGFTMIEARDLNEAIQLASRHPAARAGSVEVRPILEPEGVLVAPLDRRLAAAIRRSGEAGGRQDPESLARETEIGTA